MFEVIKSPATAGDGAVADQGGDSSADDEASDSRSGFDTADSRDYTDGSTASGLPGVSDDDSLENFLQPKDLTQ